MTTMTYGGCVATIELDQDADLFHGVVIAGAALFGEILPFGYLQSGGRGSRAQRQERPPVRSGRAGTVCVECCLDRKYLRCGEGHTRNRRKAVVLPSIDRGGIGRRSPQPATAMRCSPKQIAVRMIDL
jgi:hypothetical protein